MERKFLTVPPSHAPHVNVAPSERMLSVFAAGTLAAVALRQKRWTAAALGASGGILLWRGMTGHCPMYGVARINSAEIDYRGQHTERVITINKSPEDLYAFWRNFENLPQIMDHLESVRVIDERRSVWRAKAPVRGSVEWEAEIVDEVPNKRIAWHSIGRSRVPNAGAVHFEPTAAGQGTIVRVSLDYQPPGGNLGVGLAKVMGRSPGKEIEQDLRRFKAVMEAGEMPTTEGQSSGRR